MATIDQGLVVTVKSLPVDAQAVVSQHRNVLFGEVSGTRTPNLMNAALGTTPDFVDYQPLPITHVVTHADHSIYNATQIEPLEDGLDPFLFCADIDFTKTGEVLTNFTGTAHRDGDPATGMNPDVLTAGPTSIHYDHASDIYRDLCFGFVLRYKAEWKSAPTPIWEFVGSPGYVNLWLFTNNAGSVNQAQLNGYWAIPYTVDPTTIIGIMPPGHYFDPINAPDPIAPASGVVNWHLDAAFKAEAGTLASPADLEIYEFMPLIKNVPLLDGIGNRGIRIPAQTPKQITVRGYVPPEKSHTFPGWPGGSIDVDVSRQHQSATECVIDVEQAGPTPLPDGTQGSMDLVLGSEAIRRQLDRETRRRNYSLSLARKS